MNEAERLQLKAARERVLVFEREAWPDIERIADYGPDGSDKDNDIVKAVLGRLVGDAYIRAIEENNEPQQTLR